MHIPREQLRDSIAEALWQVKAYELPGLCKRLGLPAGESNEAFAGKKTYAKKRLADLPEQDLLHLATKVLHEINDPALADVVSEMTVHSEHRITDITRRDMLKTLNSVNPLFGETDLFEGLNIVSSESLSHEALGAYPGFPSLYRDIEQHYIKNDDLSNEELLIKCGALTCAQARFFELLEKLLDPAVRRGDDQTRLVSVFNTILKVDGFHVVATNQRSGHLVYEVQRIATGVTGAPKNLIFAAIRTKPDLYFTDAINNEIAIRNVTDALIYDRLIPKSGLLWATLVEWWKEHEGFAGFTEAQTALYKRLELSVRGTSSSGELALFQIYYGELRKVLDVELPALIPQVYLHYDPRTRQERGSSATATTNGHAALARPRHSHCDRGRW